MKTEEDYLSDELAETEAELKAVREERDALGRLVHEKSVALQRAQEKIAALTHGG